MRNHDRSIRDRVRGFTLIEPLVVIAIIAILAGIIEAICRIQTHSAQLAKA
jgi:prepilin-type N-terminal cleavage/methylation domain-containing protein